MKLTHKIAIILIVVINFTLNAKSKGNMRLNISIPQFSSGSSGVSSMPFLAPGLNPYLYNSPAYGNLLLNQYNANMNAITSRIPQPQSDLGAQYLDKHIQKEISEEITTQSIQSGTVMPVYRITNIIDHGRTDNTKDSKFRNVDYLLWKFQNLEEGISIQVKGNQIELGSSLVFADKPDSLLAFIHKEKDYFFLLESRVNEVMTGLLVNGKTRKVLRIQCTKQNSNKNYEYSVVGEEGEFWNYLSLFEK